MGESESERERESERGMVEMEQGGKQGGNGGKNPATGKAPPGPDLANLQPHRGNFLVVLFGYLLLLLCFGVWELGLGG